MASNNQRFVAEFSKNSVEKVRIHISEYNNSHYVDIRIWFLNEARSDGGELPTRKGLRLHCELLPDLITALEKARDIIAGKA